MGKKGQVTIFMVLAIFILAASSLFFYFKSDAQKQELEKEVMKAIEVHRDLIPVKEYYENCVNGLTQEAILLAGYQGGFVELISGFPSMKTSFSDVHFWKFEESRLVWSDFNDFVASQINKYLKENMHSCIEETKEKFPGVSYSDNAAPTTAIAQDSVAVSIDYPISISLGGRTSYHDKFSTKVPVRLGLILDSARKIADKQIDDVDKIDLDFLSKFDFSVSAIVIGDGQILYKIVDKKSMINSQPYIFLFAEKYNLESNGNNYAPRLALIGDIKANVGQKVSIMADASDINGDALKFSSSSDIFKITDKGLIEFTPTKEDEGIHFASVTVKDGKGLSDIQLFRIEVV